MTHRPSPPMPPNDADKSHGTQPHGMQPHGLQQRALLDGLVRRQPWDPRLDDPSAVIEGEWLVTNGLGGYASSTFAGLNTRRYHGMLVAALPNPMGRVLMLSRVEERVLFPDGTTLRLDADERTDGLHAQGARSLAEFRLEAGLPVWRYAFGASAIEKRVLMTQGQNTVYVHYTLVTGSESIVLALRPAVHFRSYEGAVSTPLSARYHLADDGDQITLSGDEGPSVRLDVVGESSTFELRRERIDGVVYRLERARGYDSEGSLWSPGQFRVVLTPRRAVTFVASAETAEIARAIPPEDAIRLELERRRRLLALAPAAARSAEAAELVLAADQFLITPVGRHAEATRARAVGDEVRSVIAGYHWFTDWGRDTMISLEGLTLATGRHREAGFILRTFVRYVRNGLIPNMFPDGSNEGLYHTADATLWFFHAVDRYVQHTGDTDTLLLMLPALRDIVQQHVRGTRFGIGVDEHDGLLREGAEGYQLTWMDAKVGDWVVTPRRGKPVEINALWYNALRLLARWLQELGDPAEAQLIAQRAERVGQSFNARFWFAEGEYLYDVVDGPEGDSAEFRPNQIFAISLPNPVLDPSRWRTIVDKVEQRLLTPVGLRSLAPGSAGYRPRYDGDLRARDAAYHQGTVWAWLIGPWIDAWLRVHPEDRAGARRFLDGVLRSVGNFGIGSLAEVFDAEPPYTQRGCIAQAWSVAETLRCLARLQEH